MDSFIRELRFVARDPVALLTIVVAGLLSIFTVISGLKEIAAERSLIERVEQMVTEDREYSIAGQSDPGGAAYYAFHFTYDPPSSLAFASRGIRDDLPWKHRIRMLALEGQIYETDSGNPELSRIGKLDFAFVAAFLLPLLSILLLHDLRASEVRNNRWTFLSATGRNGNNLLQQRTILRMGLLFLAAVIPFIFGGIVSGASVGLVALVISIIGINLVFWSFLSLVIIKRVQAGPTAAAILLGAWFVLAIAIPVGGKLAVEAMISVPKGGEILLTQREAVNDAWDLPREATMKPFYERHPEWANAEPTSAGFDWYWYYAFQQVGDQTVEEQSQSLRQGIAARDKAMRTVSFLSPPLFVDRIIEMTARTNIESFQIYDQCVRDFHKSLRAFHYQMLFGEIEYSEQVMKQLPKYRPCYPNQM